MHHRQSKGALLSSSIVALVIFFFSFQPGIAAAIPYTSLPPGRQLLPGSGLKAFTTFGKQAELAKIEIKEVSGTKFDKALKVITSPGAHAEYAASCGAAELCGWRGADQFLGGL
jgi:hypothetical protein